MASKKLKIPTEWSFEDASVAANFEVHVRESLPWYDAATWVVTQLARAYIPQDGVVVDVGCSTGNIGRAIADILSARGAELFPIDSSEAILENYKGPGKPLCDDVRVFDFHARRPHLIICFLSLMFVPTYDRCALIRIMRQSLSPGGALIIFDKMVSAPGYAGTALYRMALAAKREAGVDPADVVDKEISLSGLQRPLAANLFLDAVPVFRFGDFAGFIFETP